MSSDLFANGLKTILAAIDAALTDRKVSGAVVTHNARGTAPQKLTVTIQAHGKAAEQMFEIDEITDSGFAIDAPAAAKVRLFVGQFVS